MNSKMVLVLGIGLLIALAIYKFVPDDLTPMQRSVTNELRNQGFENVDVKSLDKGRLGEIHLLMTSDKSPGDIRDGIKAILNRGS